MSQAPGFRLDVSEAVFKLPVAAALGFTFQELADGHAETRMDWRVEHSQAPGRFRPAQLPPWPTSPGSRPG